jgi:hypothetical protein
VLRVQVACDRDAGKDKKENSQHDGSGAKSIAQESTILVTKTSLVLDGMMELGEVR